MLAAPSPPPDSTTSGYSVPWTRNSTSPSAPTTSRAARSKLRMNSRPMILRFASGSVTPASAPEELVGGVDDHQVHAGRRDEVAFDLFGLTLPEQAVVDEHAGQLGADGALHQGRGHRRVDPAGEAADEVLGPDLGPDRRHRLLDDVGGRPVRPAAGDVEQEVLQDQLAGLGVLHLGMPLHPGQSPLGRLEGGDRRAGAGGQRVETGRGRGHRVAVTHPDPQLLGNARQQGAGPVDRGVGPAELAQPGPRDVAAQRAGHGLESVADAEGRHAGLEQAADPPAARPARTPTAVRRTG